MMIMPLSGNDIGFSQKTLRKLAAAIGVQPEKDFINDLDGERYLNSVLELPIKAEKHMRREEGEVADVAGRTSGYVETVGIELMLEGTVFATPSIVDDRLKAIIKEDIEELGLDEARFMEIVKGLEEEVQGIKERQANAEIVAFSRNPDGTANVTVRFTIVVEGGESSHERRQRANDERGEAAHDLWNDER